MGGYRVYGLSLSPNANVLMGLKLTMDTVVDGCGGGEYIVTFSEVD